ncbi:MAG: hypothetical protein R2695_07785 [Acidimicrobiales bacterium]
MVGATDTEARLREMTYAQVFDHLELTTGVRVTFGAVDGRVFDDLAELRSEVGGRIERGRAGAAD